MAGECAPPKQLGDAKSAPRFGPDRTVDSTTSTHARYVDMTASSRAASTSSLDTRTYDLHAQAAHPSGAKSTTIAGATACECTWGSARCKERSTYLVSHGSQLGMCQKRLVHV